ncbi:LuxR C-terminal-related transcriptional regulator [Devosia sp. XGJD_8]|uniref:LuxR C-terminal-related transcriptional regulator n=1 Tax=Devosia sp. XGJD_8 TaxID=3391187 RepID=UPI00398543B4
MPLVTTKLNLPLLRPRVVARPRLRALLDRCLETRLTLISAPAGFGKTTLLADWLANSAPPGLAVAWLSLDESDSEPSAFWPHVVAALQAASARAGAAFPDLPSAMQPDQGFVAILLNQLTTGEIPLVLILDDLHLIDRRDIHEQLGFFIDHLPPHVHVIIGTRADPGLPLARLRVRGDLVEIRSADLRFTAEEAAAYLNDVMHLGLSPADAATLDRKTEGWIAALQLAVLSLEGRDDAAAFIEDFAGSGRYVFDYLIDEVLARLPDDLHDFLLTTSVLRRMSAPLCDAVTDEPGSSRNMLDRLERQNLFLVPLDAHRQWFRYHHLFADVLRTHLTDTQTEAFPALHRRASEWYESHGERAEAIHHALEARDYEWAAELIERAIPQIRKHRQEALFRAWMQPIPDAIVKKRPVLGVAYAGVLVSLGAFDGIEDRLRTAEAEIVNLADPNPLLAHVELYRTALAQVQGDVVAAAEHAHRVLDLAPKSDHLTRAGAAGFLGIVSWTKGDLNDAARFWTECRDRMREEGHVADVQGTTIALADIRNTQGLLTEAMQLCEAALSLATDNGRPMARGAADTHASLAFLHLERNELTSAREHLDRCRELGEVWGLPQFPYRSRVAQARLDLAVGRAAEALEHLREAERRYVSDFFPNVRPVPALIANVHIRLGQLDAAERWVKEAAIGADDPPAYPREFEHVTLTRLLVAHGDSHSLDTALRLIDRLAHAASEGGRGRSLVDLHILAALAHRARHELPAAIEALRRAIALAEPESLRRPFLDEGDALAPLFKLLSKREVTSVFARSIVSAGAAVAEPAPPLHHDLIEPLSDRERDVLRLLRSDLSGPEIADELAVSLNTLRTHTKNIFEKLGVNSRRAAVRRAEEMQLFARDARD